MRSLPGAAQDCAVMQEEEDGHFQVRKVVELGVYSTATATVELVECPSEELIC